MPVSYITYKGKKIIYTDLRESKTEEQSLKLLEETVKHYEEADGDVLGLTNAEGAYMNPQIIDQAKHYAKTVFGPKAKKRAFVGMKGLKGIVFNAYSKIQGNPIRNFNTEEEALAYLVR